jgi:hypothetical protein
MNEGEVVLGFLFPTGQKPTCAIDPASAGNFEFKSSLSSTDRQRRLSEVSPIRVREVPRDPDE